MFCLTEQICETSSATAFLRTNKFFWSKFCWNVKETNYALRQFIQTPHCGNWNEL